MLDAGQWYRVNNDSIAVIPVKTGIQIFVILSDPSSVAVALLLRRVEAKDLFLKLNK